MRERQVGLTKEQYDEIKALGRKEQAATVEKLIPDYIVWGYGYYGFVGLGEDGGRYFAVVKTGSTCD